MKKYFSKENPSENISDRVESQLQDGGTAGELEHGVGHHVTHQQLILSIVLVTT